MKNNTGNSPYLTFMGLTGTDKKQIASAMQMIWALVSLSFECEINIVPELRKKFPMLEWTFKRLANETMGDEDYNLSYAQAYDEFTKSHFAWDFVGSFLFAKFKEAQPAERFSFHFVDSCQMIDQLESTGKKWLHFARRTEDISAQEDMIARILFGSVK